AGTYVDVADELGIYSLGEVTLGAEQWLRSNNIHVSAQTLNLMNYSGFGTTGECGVEDTSLFLSTVGDMNLEPYEGQGLQYLYFEHQDVVLDIGGNLNGEDWFLAYMSQLTVGGDMALYSLDS